MRTKERGSVVGYVIGAVLLLALLLGGIVLYKNYAGNLEKAPVVGQNNETKPADESEKDDQAAQNEAAVKKQQEEAEKKAKEQSEAVNGSTNGTDATVSENEKNKPAVTQVPHTSTAPGELPTTGPAEDAMLIAVGISAVTGVAIAYRRSVAAL